MTDEVYITRIGSFLPNDPVSNDEMEEILGRIGGRRSRTRRVILRNNGILSRHYAIDRRTGEHTHTNARMAALAIGAMTDKAFQVEQLECLACGTSSPDQLVPSHAVMVHGELKSPPCDIASFSGVCVTGVQALKYAYMSVLSGQTANAVSTGSELASALMRARFFEGNEAATTDPERDFLRWMLSDGAGAFLLQNRPRSEGLSLRIEWIDLLSYAGRMPTCMYQGAELREDGTADGYLVFRPSEWISRSILTVRQDLRLLGSSIVKTCAEALAHTVRKRSLEAGGIDWFLPHLSSEYFRQELHDAYREIGFEIPQSKWFTNLTRVGNVGSASIYLILEELLGSGRVKPGDSLLLMIPESGRFTMSYALLTAVG